MDRANVLLLVGLEAGHSFGMFAPSPFSDQEMDPEDEKLARGLSMLWSFAVAFVVAVLIKDASPIVVWGVASVFMYGIHEYVRRVGG